jgi:hypothetical protein
VNRPGPRFPAIRLLFGFESELDQSADRSIHRPRAAARPFSVA